MISTYGDFIILFLVAMTISSRAYAISRSEYKSDLHLAIGLPLSYSDSMEPIASWERGREILRGAQVAVETINSRMDILPQCKLHIIEVNIGRCDIQNHNFLISLMNATYQATNLIGAVGLFCPIEVQLLLQMHGNPTSKSEFLRTAVEATYYTKSSGRYTFFTLMIRAMLEFYDVLDWRNTAVIMDRDNYFFSYFAEAFYRASSQYTTNISVVVYRYSANILRSLRLPRIVLLSVGDKMVTELLCNAYREDLMWPKHVWIIHTHHFEAIAKLNASCNVEMALENVLFFSENISLSFTRGDHGLNNSNSTSHYLNEKLNANLYSFVLHDLVWSLVLEVNKTLDTEHRSKIRLPSTNLNTENRKTITITQVSNCTQSPLATYTNNLKLTVINSHFVMTAPSDELLTVVVGGSTLYTAFFTTEIVLLFILVTIMFVGYTCFRNEPEVKSTSFSLSLLIFLGCYLMLVYLSILLYFHQPWPISDTTLDGLCISLNWFSGLGISSCLIFATSLVKILRIYHIFSKHDATRLSKRCTDSYLAMYVGLLISPLVFIHTLWTIVDPYLGKPKVSTELNIVRVEKECYSKYSLLWYVLLTTYMTLVLVILLTLAIKMRKIIQTSHFKQTKKVAILVSCYFVDLLVILTSWRILYTFVNAYYAAIVLHVGHVVILMICQLVIFAPKVLPPFIRCVKRSRT